MKSNFKKCIVKASDEFEAEKFSTIEVELVNFGRDDRIKFARKHYQNLDRKPCYYPIGSVSLNEAKDLAQSITEILDKKHQISGVGPVH
jgi:hypothetical protein